MLFNRIRHTRSKPLNAGLALLATVLVGVITTHSVLSASAGSAFVTRNGSHLELNGQPFRFAGTNLYYVGLDDNIRDSAGNPTYPSKFRIDNAFVSAKAMNATVVRAHTLGISVGCAQCLEPSLGVYNDKAFESMDYAVEAAGKNGIKLMIPLTDQWQWYHGGKHTFTEWAGYKSISGVNAGQSQDQKAIEANFYTDPKVIGYFQDYVSHLLNHVNQFTGVALKDDPTVMAWETGNEIWDAPPSWTEQTASFIKHTVGAKQLVADGTAANGMHTAQSAVDAKDVDIMGGHFYDGIDINWAKQDAATAAAHNKAYVIGEFAWTEGALGSFVSGVENDPNIAGDLYWTLLPKMEDGSYEQHGDGYQLHYPGDNDSMKASVALLTKHAATMTAKNAAPATTAAPTTAPTTTAKPAPVTSAPTTTAKPAPTTSAPSPTSTVKPTPITAAPGPTTTAPVVSAPSTGAPMAVNTVGAGRYNDTQFTYAGAWATGDGAAKYIDGDHYSSSAGATAAIKVAGTSFVIYGTKASHHGMATVTIDGAPWTIDLYSANRQDQVPIFASPQLSNGTHSVVVKVNGQHDSLATDNVVAIDRIDVTSAGVAPAKAPGLTGEYFANNTLLGTPLATRTDGQINMKWGKGSPAGLPADGFSVRWTGALTAPTTGVYKLTFSGDDGYRVKLNGQTLIDNWNDHSEQSRTASVTLTAGQANDLVVEFYEHKGNASARLQWSGPGINKQDVPASALTH